MFRSSDNKIKSIFTLTLLFVLMSFTLLVNADSFDKRSKNIPEDLKQWIPWVLKDQPDIKCPVLYNNNEHLCAYPGSLSIAMGDNSGAFLQAWDIYAESFVPLPGDNKNWPENIIVNEHLQPVISRDGKPFVQLQKGRYSIKGYFYWQQLPKYLSIPDETGLISLTINDEAVNMPDFRNGKLWLKTAKSSTHQNNRLDLHIFRKVTDTIPVKIETIIKLDVSGQQREVILNGALLDDFTASAVNSRLPAQINKQGQLKIQVRAGQWIINVASFYAREINSIALPGFEKPWPDNEIWVLHQQPQLRRINVTGKISIDANQTQLPGQWKKYPAFQMKSGEKMDFEVIERGDPEPEPDQLNLTKKIWLDFDGKGLTVNDKISGKLSRQWRLNASKELVLGQVSLNGAPQYITQSTQGNEILHGVEVRHGNINLSADSRIESQQRTFSSSGWDIDFNRVNATLYLPAGWKLFSLSGADASDTWLKKWTLLDLFLVLITAIAIFKLWGLQWGIVALIALVLTWHQPDAPQFIWINLILAAALLRALPSDGRIYKFIRNYRFIVLIFLAIIILPFIIHQARTALYPQLEFSTIANQYNHYASDSYDESGEADSISMNEVMPSVAVSKSKRVRMPYSIPAQSTPQAERLKSSAPMDSIDPNAMIQTGPGLPSWTLKQYRIHWNGPVRKDQTISMTLISPVMNSILNILRIVFILLLAWRLVDVSKQQIRKVADSQLNKASGKALSLSSVLLLGGLLFLSAPVSEAAFPTETLLEELETELNKAAECLPQCAAIESAGIELSAQKLSVKLLVHALEDVSIPLPVPLKQWMPSSILLDDKPASGLFRHDSRQLWLFLAKGSHSVEINGRVDYLNQLQISFPLKPHHIRLKVEGWSAEGMDEDITKVSALSFLKLNSNQKALSDIGQSDIPVFAEIKRTLNLGLSWGLTTQIRAVQGTSYPAILKIPLLAGESVLSDKVRLENGHAIITLQHKGATVQWNSKLLTAKQIKLKAIKSRQIIEQWILNTSPIWHIEHSGIPVVYHQRHGDLWQPRWQPWSGEEVLIDVTRPPGVKGKTITIDSSTLTITPGEQNTASSLEFNLRSSLGGQHTIHLPDDAVLQTVSINDKSMPIRNTKDGLSLPVLPGNQTVKVLWNESRGIASVFRSSELSLGISSVNNNISLLPGSERWVLLTSGPAMGPAVLFWGVFFIILILSYALGRIKGTPLNTLQWILLWVGLSASEPFAAIIIVACIFALKARSTIDVEAMHAIKFNAFQIVLIFLVISSISALIMSIQQGLLGSPGMQISGNGSSAYHLNWFSDRIAEQLPQAALISVPVYIYRLIMLVWSIWLAFAVIKWAQWGWTAFSSQQYWKPVPIKKIFKKKSASTDKWGKEKILVDE